MKNGTLKYLILFFGIGTLSLGLVLKTVYPSEAAQMPEGFSTPITAFEFLQTDTEVLQLFGPAGNKRNELVSAMNTGHKLDYVFMIFYSLFLTTFIWFLIKKTSNKTLYFLIALSIIAGISDLFENFQLTHLADNLETKEFEPYLCRLFIFTWIKWGSLALSLTFTALSMYKNGLFQKIFTFLAFITLGSGIIAFIKRSSVTSFFTLGILVLFVMLFILSLNLVLNKKNSSDNT